MENQNIEEQSCQSDGQENLEQETETKDKSQEEIIDGLKQRVAKLETELAETRDKMLRIAAEHENYKKRTEKEKLEFLKFANERVLKDMLVIADNLERAIETAKRLANPNSIVAGLEMLLNEMLNIFKRYGVEPIDALGKPFDPLVHEALQQKETTEAQPGTVVAEVQRGYKIHHRVLRPSLVVVATAPSKSVETPQDSPLEVN